MSRCLSLASRTAVVGGGNFFGDGREGGAPLRKRARLALFAKAGGR